MRFALVLAAVMLAGLTRAKAADLTGEWVEPTGSVVRIDHCGERLCVWVVAISRKAPSTRDIYNPDASKRSRSLCGLEIGSGFMMRSPEDARDGTLYDPKTGKTYHGQMKVDEGRLNLRGYVGIPLLGVTQTWSRPPGPVSPCESGSQR